MRACSRFLLILAVFSLVGRFLVSQSRVPRFSIMALASLTAQLLPSLL